MLQCDDPRCAVSKRETERESPFGHANSSRTPRIFDRIACTLTFRPLYSEGERPYIAACLLQLIKTKQLDDGVAVRLIPLCSIAITAIVVIGRLSGKHRRCPFFIACAFSVSSAYF